MESGSNDDAAKMMGCKVSEMSKSITKRRAGAKGRRKYRQGKKKGGRCMHSVYDSQ